MLSSMIEKAGSAATDAALLILYAGVAWAIVAVAIDLLKRRK